MIVAHLPDELNCWPEHEELSVEFMRLLAAAQDGGSTIAECLLVARRIGKGDDLTWYREWWRLAEVNRNRGDVALAGGHLATARSNWLRAVNYYGAAVAPLDAADERRQASVVAMQECARRFLGAREPSGEIVTFPWMPGHDMQGYFLPAPGGPAPTVICIGESGHRKEEYLFKLAPHARERGLSILAVDFFGDRADDVLDQVMARPEAENSISSIMDYLSTRADVDGGRIAILADGWGSSFVARAVASEPRLAAAVCDGGLWDLHEQAFLIKRMISTDEDAIPCMETNRIVRGIACPVLVTVGEQGWLKPDRVRQMVQQMRVWGMDITLKVFSASETAAAQGHADNPTLANEFIFDWLTRQFERDADRA